MKKNEIVNLKIIDMGINGEGIGKVDGFPFFIKDAIIGDEIKAKITKVNKSHGFARVEEVTTPSEDRVKPRCPIARPCGGCQLQEMDYSKQLEFKENKVFQHMKRIGGFSEGLLSQVTEPIIGMENPFHYRNKASFPFGRDKGGEIVTGFYAGRTHNIIRGTDCVVGVSVNQEILEAILAYMKKNKIPPYDEVNHTGIVRHALIRYGFKTHEIMVCLVVNSDESTVLRNVEELIDELKKISGMVSVVVNFNPKKTNVIMGERSETLWGKGYITDILASGESGEESSEGIKYQISPLSFYQVNPVQTEKLYDLALDYAGLTGEELVWDLYCGIGTISLFLSQRAKKVIGVEMVPQAIEDARENARINGIENVEFIAGKSEKVFIEYYGEEFLEKELLKKVGEAQKSPEVVVLDPPRKGCDESLLEAIAKVKPERVVYVSCDSATLARDLKYLCERGYELKRLRATDMFPMTVHCECVTLLTKSKEVQQVGIKKT